MVKTTTMRVLKSQQKKRLRILQAAGGVVKFLLRSTNNWCRKVSDRRANRTDSSNTIVTLLKNMR